MSYWLHALVIYPLAGFGAITLVGLWLFLRDTDSAETDPLDRAWKCDGCGKEGFFAPHGIQGHRFCPTCEAALAAEGKR